MRIGPNAIRFIERGALSLGLLLLIIFSVAHIHRVVMFRAEMQAFERRRFESAEERHKGEAAAIVQNSVSDLDQTPNADYSLLAEEQRTRLHRGTFRRPSAALAVLRIPKLHLEAPVLHGTDEVTLNRGLGVIAGTSLPGQLGNIGIAGHRDGFFRALKNTSAGDLIELVTTAGTDVYAVDRIQTTDPANVSVLRPKSKPSLTLVTCYPFYFVGPAPKRYIVEASWKRHLAREEANGIISSNKEAR